MTEEEIDAIYTRDLRRASVAYDAMIKRAWEARAERIANLDTSGVDGQAVSTWDKESE